MTDQELRDAALLKLDEAHALISQIVGADPDPPPAQFGADLFLGYEWAQVEPTGTPVSVTTTAQLRAAVAGNAAIIDGGGRTFALGGQMDLPAHSQPMRELRNAYVTGGRIRHNNTGKWRLRNGGSSVPPTAEEDCVKGDGGGFLHIDRWSLVDAAKQGILLAPHSDVVISNSLIRSNGTSPSLDHGLYTASGARALLFSNWFDQNSAYQLHAYPSYADMRVVCNTFSGGRGSILSGITNALLVGNIFENATRTDRGGYGLEQYQPCTNVLVVDCLGRGNQFPGTSMGAGVTVTRWRNGGSPTGIIAEEFWRYVPPTDGAGNVRVTADAGAYRT